MHPINAYDKPLNVEVFDGEVVIRDSQGPSAVALTPGAAHLTADLIASAAELAEAQLASQASGSED